MSSLLPISKTFSLKKASKGPTLLTKARRTLKNLYKADFDQRYALLIKPFIMVMALSLGVLFAFLLVNVSPTIPILILGGLPIALFAFMYPQAAVFFIIFILPFENLTGGGNSFSPLKMLSVAVLALCTIHFFVFRANESLVSARQNWLILIFFLVIFLSNLVAWNSTRTSSGTIRIVLVSSLYFLVINMIRTEKQLQITMWLYVISGVFSCFYGLYAYYFDHSLLNPEHAIPRMIGTLDDPNEFGGAMISRLMLAVVLLELEKSVWKRSLLVFSIGILIFSITLTGSRGALLAMGFAFIVFVMFQENKTFWFVLLTVAAVIGLIFMPQSLKERVGLAESTSGENLGNNTDRRESYQVVGLGLFLENPILGVGFDSFAEAYSRSEYRFLVTRRQLRPAHNTYMEVMAGTGLLGLVSWFSLLGTSFHSIYRCCYYKQRYPFLGGAAVGLLGSKIGFFFLAMFLSQQYEKTLWFLLGMVVIIQTLIQEKEEQRLHSKKSSQLAVSH